MQALSLYKPESDGAIEQALRVLANESAGLTATPYFSERGLFAKFIWPDWPESAKQASATQIERFHKEHAQLRKLPGSAPEWNLVFRDWRTHSESVSVIANAFTRHFGGRVRWVESEKDARGRIAGYCSVEDIGEIALHLFWRDSSAVPTGSISNQDRAAFQASVNEVFQWASSRIRPILDALQDKLSALYGDRFRGLYVFGSYARPDAGIELPESSDLDVALILSDFESSYEEIDRYGDIVADLSLEHSLAISVKAIREADYKEKRTNFTRVISEYAIPVT